ncbi:Protein kinase, ATP binding site [Phytophthora cactorum]|nr:Protein kinase, ATP binding site [Phytophthora cactorum]
MAVVVVSERVRLSQIIALVGYSILCSSCLLLLTYLRVNRLVAFKGDAQATRKVILPAFEPLLWILAVVTGGYSVFFCIALHVKLYTTKFPPLDGEIIYSGRQFVFVLALVFLCQKSVSVPALRRAVAKSVLLASYTIPVALFPPNDTHFRGLRVLYQPSGRSSKPRTLRVHGAYIITYHVLMIVNLLIQHYYPDSSVFAATSYIVLTWGSLSPFFIWSLLRADTEYWRGMGQRACALQQAGRQSGPGQLDESISSNRIHLLIEMHKNFVIDFAHLELRRKIGAGSSATVFSGRLQQRMPVAVKVYTPFRFTEEVVAEFSHEAALCASLSHPNIVKFYGMCVCPPTICLVSELCQGSLEDILYAQAKSRSRRRITRHLLDLGAEFEDTDILDQQQMLLKIFNMLDCARAVAKSDDPQMSVGTLASIDSPVPATRTPAPPQIKMTVTGTVSYMAPEMIGCRTGLASYGEAADVYSLAITFWDILYPDREKYPVTNPMLVFEEELLSVLAQDLSDDFERSSIGCRMISSDKCFTGELLIERMEDLAVTESHGFENSTAVYFFDDGNINFCQPLAMLEEATGTESDDEPFVQQSQKAMTHTSSKSKTSGRSRLFSHLTSAFSPSGHNSSGTSSGTDIAEVNTYEAQDHTIDIVDEEVKESVTLARPAA